MNKFFLLFIYIFCTSTTFAQVLEIERQADSLFEVKDYDASIDFYTIIIDKDSSTSDIFYKRGNAFYMKKKTMKAFDDYDKAIKLDSTNGEAYAARSVVRFKLGNTNAAIRDRERSESLGVSTAKKESYLASNGISYYVGDSVKLGMGSNPNGQFRYVNIGGWGSVLMATDRKYSENDLNIGRGYANMMLQIKKIKKYKFKGNEKVYFVIAGGNITNYNLYIEEAIATCEVVPCNKLNQAPQISIADEILKAKKLLDDGIISKEEFDKIKKKLLGD